MPIRVEMNVLAQKYLAKFSQNTSQNTSQNFRWKLYRKSTGNIHFWATEKCFEHYLCQTPQLQSMNIEIATIPFLTVSCHLVPLGVYYTRCSRLVLQVLILIVKNGKFWPIICATSKLRVGIEILHFKDFKKFIEIESLN